MQFVCLGYMEEAKWDKMPKSEQEAMMEECFAYDEILQKNGHWNGAGESLQSSRAAKTVRWENGNVIVTDGPYAETKEQIGGLLMLEARDMDHAVELMSKHPGVRYGGPFEIRPADEETRCAERRDSARANIGSSVRKIFVNLPVSDLKLSMEFFQGLGFEFNPQFTDENAACMVVSEYNYVMLLTKTYFQTFTPKPISDAAKTTEVLTAISCQNREEVDELVQKAVAGGGSTYNEPKDHGFMYQHGFQDPDGHIWELFYMDETAIPQT